MGSWLSCRGFGDHDDNPILGLTCVLGSVHSFSMVIRMQEIEKKRMY